MHDVQQPLPLSTTEQPSSLWRVPNLAVLLSLLRPAVRSFVLGRHKHKRHTRLASPHRTHFDWTYARDKPELARLYEAAKRDQWNASDTLDWSLQVDPEDPAHPLLLDTSLPVANLASYKSLPRVQQCEQVHGFVAWLLSQFLHGEQGALYAACELAEAIEWIDGKLYASTQVVDEGRHIEVFHRYIHTKLQKIYPVNDNLFTIIDAVVTDSRWDMKFLGMQIMIEGLALGAFGVLRHNTREPLLRELLRYVITDEARHVHYGVVALSGFYASLPEPQRREREDWAFEVAVLLRNRFLAHEFYDEYYGHLMSRKSWNKLVLASPYMLQFRDQMFRRLVPNLKRIGLLSGRVRPHYAALNLLQYEHDKAAA